MGDKKAQVEVTFNWMYILIAGGIILLFFVGLIVRQKTVAEDNLANSVVRIMGTIFTGAGVSEDTKSFIDTSGLAEMTFYFSCTNGVGEYGLQGKGAKIKNNIDPVFAPTEIKSPQLIAWSLPYKLPYKVIDLLFITSSNSLYYLYGTEDDAIIADFQVATQGMTNVFTLQNPSEYSDVDPQQNYQIRVVDATGTIIPNLPLPQRLERFDDERVTALVLQGNKADYYQKYGRGWKKLTPRPLEIISLGGERDAATFAAIFAGSPESYQCNMQKAFKRLQAVTGLQQFRLQEIKNYYALQEPSGECMTLVSTNPQGNAEMALQVHYGNILSCLASGTCLQLVESAQSLVDINHDLSLNCISLY